MDLKYDQGVKSRTDNEDNRSAKVVDGAPSMPYLPTRYSKYFVMHRRGLQTNESKIVESKDR